MNETQRYNIQSICSKLGGSKTQYMAKKIKESKKKTFSLLELQEWTGMGLEYSKMVKNALDSFECPESFCIAMEMQDEILATKREAASSTKLIMTGPISQSNVGYTMGNFRKLIETAQHEIMLVGYAFNNIRGQIDHIIESLISASQRGVNVMIFFEGSAKKLAKNWDACETGHMPELYRYNKKKIRNSVLHAKVLIRDGDTIFVTSANLTGSAMEKNIELGIMHIGKLASEARNVILELIDSGYLVKEN